MAYKACYHCELLFDVDDVGPNEVMPCPQCGQALEPYQPADERAFDNALYPEAEPEGQQDNSSLIGDAVPAPVNAAIVATHAFDGLSSSVREQLAVRQANLSSEMAQARPTAQAPTPFPGDAQDSGKGENRTRILDVTDAKDKIDAMVASAAAGAPTADVENRFGSQVSSGSRNTRIEGVPILGVPVAPPAFSAVETPPPLVRNEPPPPLEPIGPNAPRRQTQPPPVEASRRTQAMPALAVMPPPAASTPRSPTGRNQPVAITPIPQPDEVSDVRPAGRQGSGGGGKGKLIAIVAAVVVLGGGGTAAFLLTRHPSAPVVAPTDTPTPTSDAPHSDAPSADPFTAALADAQAELPRAKVGDGIKEGAAFVAGGPEGLSTSFGAVPGLPSVTLPEPQIDRDAGGEWVKPLKGLLESNVGGNPGRLTLALDFHVDAKTCLRLVYSGFKGGFRQFGLGVDRGPEGHGQLAFSLTPKGTPLPAEGAIMVSVGSISVKADVQDATGAIVSDGIAVPHKDPGARPDLDALQTRIDALLKAHPAVKRVIVYPNPEMSLEQLAAVVERVGPGGNHIPEVSIGLR